MTAHILAIAAVLLTSQAAETAADPSTSGPASATVADAYYRFVLGRYLESEGEIDRAIEAHRAAAKLDPQSAEIRAELAGVYARQGRLEDAITEARAALNIDDANHEAHRVVGTLLASAAEEAATPDMRDRQLADAIAHLEKARRADGVSEDPSVGLSLGRLYLRTGEPAKAADRLRSLAEDHPVIEVWLLLAQAYSAAGKPVDALRALEEGSTFDPRLFVSLAEMYERQDQWNDAAAAYERAAALGSPTADLRTRWAGALLNAPGDDAAGRARALLESVVAEDQSDDRALYMLSQAHRRLRAFDAAEEAARRVIALQPGSLWGPYALAQVYEERREYGKVVETLTPVLAKWVPSRSAPARHGLTLLTHLGFAQLQLGRNQDAVATFERARTLAEGDTAFDVYLAQALVADRRFDEALKVVTPIREKQPTDYRVAQIAVRALSGAGRTDEAVGILRSVVAANPSEPNAYLALANLLAEGKREKEAHEVLDGATQRFPRDATVAFQRGALYERSGDLDKAETAFRRVLEHDPNHAPTLNYMGYMFAERGIRLDEAVQLIDLALKVDPDNGAYLDSLGWAYFQLKQYDRAYAHLARAAEQMPSNSVVQDHLGDVLSALGRRDEAIAAWARALSGDRDSVEIAAIEGKIRRARSQAER